MTWTGFADGLSAHTLLMTAQRLGRMALEPAARTAVLAGLVWSGLRLGGVRQVRAQRLAWGLVLLGSVAMPALMRWPVLPANGTVERWLAVPVRETAAAPGQEPGKTAATVDTAAWPSVPRSTVRHQKPKAGGIDYAVHPVAEGGAWPVATHPAVAAKTATAGASAEAIGRKLAAYAQRWAGVVWMGVSVLLLLRLLMGLAMAMRIWARAEEASALLEPRCAVRISGEVPTPVTFGAGVVLPASYTEWDRSKLRMVLAHERAHVRQGDFWLQLAARVYASVFWFSPVSWWMKRRLTELGEAMSDRAAAEEAEDRSSYAEVLLEFAAMPRRTARMAAMTGMSIAGWGLRRASLRKRIELLLTERQFRMAFTSSRIHAMAALVLVPAAIVAAASPVVQAAGAKQTAPVAQTAPVQTAAPSTAAAAPSAQAAGAAPVVQANPETSAAPQSAAGTDSQTAAPQVTANPASQNTAVPAQDDAPVVRTEPVGPVAPDDAAPVMVLQAGPGVVAGPVILQRAGPEQGMLISGPVVGQNDSDDDGQDRWTIVSNGTMRLSGAGEGRFFGDVQKLQGKEHGSYILFRHEGKAYVIDDPALVEQARNLYAPLSDLGRRQAELGEQQARLGGEQAALGRLQAGMEIRVPDIHVSIDTKMLQKQIEQAQKFNQQRMADLQEKLKKLPPDLKITIPDVSVDTKQLQLQLKELDQIHGPDMSAMQQQLAHVQVQLGALQSHLAGQQAELGEKQAKLGEQQAELGKQQAELGQQQSKVAEQANTTMKMMLDQALKSGKAKPVE
ncbi:M56 family metallopeptidase [Paracidobacterium acidisoli]|uniref:Peptidase M56 domain-containing protein n=1 Tax=Paracidobacterium acidisoli TaxID=2303751 RepID=A0A372IMV7_9BACT|nr:M56 family metallopeptidase [Paracidobacterium acidisoli]MBT9331848.1 hypothetical protein [Paracidobacterium acidisoli]